MYDYRWGNHFGKYVYWLFFFYYNKIADSAVYFTLCVLLFNAALLYTAQQYNFYRDSWTFNNI